MKKIHLLPPPSEKQIYIVQTKMAIHDIVSLAYYLENFDRLKVFLISTRIDPEALVIQDCGLNDEHLSVMGKRVSDNTIIDLAKSYFDVYASEQDKIFLLWPGN